MCPSLPRLLCPAGHDDLGGAGGRWLLLLHAVLEWRCIRGMAWHGRRRRRCMADVSAHRRRPPQNTEEEAWAQMDFALEQGVNFFDTAGERLVRRAGMCPRRSGHVGLACIAHAGHKLSRPSRPVASHLLVLPRASSLLAELYPVPPRAETCGRTEEYIGRWMAARGNRSKIVLATKVMGASKVGGGDWCVQQCAWGHESAVCAGGPRIACVHAFTPLPSRSSASPASSRAPASACAPCSPSLVLTAAAAG